MNIFELNGLPSKNNPYLFNGDFVDRGSFSVEVILTFLLFKMSDPECIHLHRGNHETRNMNKIYGFEGEVKAKYDEKIFDLFLEVFAHMPLASVVGKKVFVTHGGLPTEPWRHLIRHSKHPTRMRAPQLWTHERSALGGSAALSGEESLEARGGILVRAGHYRVIFKVE